MADRIYTFQQRLELQLIEQWLTMALLPNRNRTAMQEGFSTLCRTLETDPYISDELKPTIYFATRSVFGERATVDTIIQWMQTVHHHIDIKSSKGVMRD